MKVKVFPNPEFDFAMGYMGGFEDVPTKQDKFKPVNFSNLECDDEKGGRTKVIESLYVVNEKKRESQSKFEEMLKSQIKENLKDHHPYKWPQQLEVVIGVNTSTKRFKEVDIDNLVKCILDCFNGLVYEDDSQIASLIASKHVIKDDFVPEVSGVMIGIRLVSDKREMLNRIPIYIMENVED